MPAKERAAFGAIACGAALGVLSCQAKAYEENWSCDFDASVQRPLGDPSATVDDAGSLPSGACMTTCGPPVTACKFVLLDASVPGAVCPVCTF